MKISIMAEVSDEIYNDVVLPYKQKREFGKLVVQLLEAYHNNESIYNYINGSMDEIKNDAKEELLKDLNSMAQSLNMFSMLGNEAEATIENGKTAFEDIGSRARERNEKTFDSKDSSDMGEHFTREDIKDIVEESVSDIRGMLEKLLDSGVTVRKAEVEEPVVAEIEEPVGVLEGIEEVIEEPVEDDEVAWEDIKSRIREKATSDEKVEDKQDKFEEWVYSEDIDWKTPPEKGMKSAYEEEEVSEEEKEEAQDALASLMGSIGEY